MRLGMSMTRVSNVMRLFVLVLLCAGLVGCVGPVGPTGPAGPPGLPGEQQPPPVEPEPPAEPEPVEPPVEPEPPALEPEPPTDVEPEPLTCSVFYGPRAADWWSTPQKVGDVCGCDCFSPNNCRDMFVVLAGDQLICT